MKRKARRTADRVVDATARALDVRQPGLVPALLRSSSILPRPVPAFWWGSTNFGDALSRVVMGHVSGATPVHVTHHFSGKILGIGSILHHALAEGDVVWGSGAIRADRISPPSCVRFLAVRGPLTQSLVQGDVPSVFGDPSILLPSIYQPESRRRFQVGIVPHYVDRAFIRVADPQIAVIDVTWHWQRVIDMIASCDVIVSSSLHGLIVAEAYGVPAAWMSVSNKLLGGPFKFNDYYLATGRTQKQPTPWSKGMSKLLSGLEQPPLLDGAPLRQAWEDWSSSIGLTPRAR